MAHNQSLLSSITFENKDAVLDEVGAELGIQNPKRDYDIREVTPCLYDIVARESAWRVLTGDVTSGSSRLVPSWRVSDDLEEVRQQAVDDTARLISLLSYEDRSSLARSEGLAMLRWTIHPSDEWRDIGLERIRDVSIAIRPSTIKARSRAVFGLNPPGAFRGTKLIIPKALAPPFVVCDIRVAGVPQLTALLAADTFHEMVVGSNLEIDTAMAGATIELEIMNITEVDAPFRAAIIGRTNGLVSNASDDLSARAAAEILVERHDAERMLPELRQTPSGFYYWKPTASESPEMARVMLGLRKY